MSTSDDDEYGSMPDEDLIELESQASQQPPSQTLPQLPPLKRRRISSSDGDEDEISEDETTFRHRRKSRHFKESGDGVEESEEQKSKQKKEKYKILIHGEGREAPKAMIVGATQADSLPDSSPSRIRGPIYKRPRPEAPKTAVNSTTQRRPTAPLDPSQRTLSFARTNSGISQRERDEVEAELLDLPSDAFSSSPESAFASKRPAANGLSSSFDTQRPQQRIAAPQTGLRQTTLFGGRASQAEVPASQVGKVHNYRVDMPPEVPNQHALDYEALKTWVYPTNLGEIRDYQYSIVKNGLFNNLLVALPTGLGKTFIAATIMFNYFRWTKDAKIIFVAPTKPLVSQQVEACFNIVGIPRSATVMLTGEIEKSLRAEEWLEKRVFFMTPQTLENDLKYGYADPKKIVLLVVDEAHRATGTYAYVNVVKFLRQFNKSFRVLALTATPGAKVEKIQEVIDSLEISKVEIRTEESIDIQQFVHRRDIEQIVLDPSEEMVMIYELYSKALQPLVNILCSQNSFYNKDPMALTPYGMIQAKTNWVKSDAGRNANQGTKYMMYTLFTILGSLAHGIKMLHFHGIGPFFATVKEFRQEVEGKGDKGSKYKKQIVDCPEFKQMMDRIQMWLNKDDFVGHPKMTYLCDTVLNHFLDAGEGRLGQDAPPSSTRVIVFSEYRDSAEEITRVLNRHGPMVRASVFVGQADSKRSAGMNQAAQQETIRKFKTGTFNVLVATSIGEEGLDIGQVDLIVCYDSSASPIRMLQRMGRTGRKRAGKIVLLLLRGKEEQSFVKSKDNYEKMQQEITSGARLSLRHDLSVRIIPRDIKPVLEKRVIEIPIENTQDPSMPEPKRRGRGAAKKAPKKKFHMPDGVETGFRKASKLSEDGTSLAHFGVTRKPREAAKIQLAEIPKLESVLLSPEEEEKFHRNYLLISGADVQEVEMPNVTSQTVAQRRLSITVNVPHGRLTKRCVRLFKTLAKSQLPENRDIKPYGDEALIDYSWSPPPALADEDEEPKTVAKATKPIPAARKQSTIMQLDESDEEADARGAPARKKTRKRRRARLRESEDEGESIDKSDTEEASGDESEDVGSLKDFLASEGPTITRTSTATVASSPVVQLKEQLFFEPTQFTATQDTNDDMPDIGDLLSIKKPTKNLDLALSSDEDISDREVTTVVTKKVPIAKATKDMRIDSDGDISDWEASPVAAKKISVEKSSKSMRIGSDGDISDSEEPIKPVRAKPFARPLSLDINSDDDDDKISDEEPISSTKSKYSGRTLLEDSDEDVRPITGRKKRRTVVEDDDSDE